MARSTEGLFLLLVSQIVNLWAFIITLSLLPFGNEYGKKLDVIKNRHVIDFVDDSASITTLT